MDVLSPNFATTFVSHLPFRAHPSAPPYLLNIPRIIDTRSQHAYGYQIGMPNLFTGLGAPAPSLGVHDPASFTSIPGGNCPTPALVPPTPRTASSSSFLHPILLSATKPQRLATVRATPASQPHPLSSCPAPTGHSLLPRCYKTHPSHLRRARNLVAKLTEPSTLPRTQTSSFFPPSGTGRRVEGSHAYAVRSPYYC